MYRCADSLSGHCLPVCLCLVVMVVALSYLWDVTQDWGLGDPSKHLLNERRMGPK